MPTLLWQQPGHSSQHAQQIAYDDHPYSLHPGQSVGEIDDARWQQQVEHGKENLHIERGSNIARRVTHICQKSDSILRSGSAQFNNSMPQDSRGPSMDSGYLTRYDAAPQTTARSSAG